MHFAARLGASVPMMASISNSRFTQDSRAGLAAGPLSRHLTSDLANVVETHSFVERQQVRFWRFDHEQLAYGTVRSKRLWSAGTIGKTQNRLWKW